MKAAIRPPLFSFLRPAEAVPYVLNLRNIYLLPTGYGLLYLTLLGGMLVGSINYNNNLGFLLTFLLGSLGVMGIIYTYRMIYGLQVESATADAVFAGDPLTVTFTFRGGRRWRMGLRLYFDPSDQVIADVVPGRDVRIAVRATTRQRGIFDPGNLKVSCTYPLGLFRAWAGINPNLKCLVYPRPEPRSLAEVEPAASKGEGDRGQMAGVEDFDGLAPYQPGDSPKRIHWPAFSRGRGVHIKQFCARSGAALMLDINAVDEMDTERKLSILCFWVLTAHQQKLDFGLTLDRRHTVAVGSGPGQRDRCLRELALYGDH